jgi:hypothetical protein
MPPVMPPPKRWLYSALSGHHNFSAARRQFSHRSRDEWLPHRPSAAGRQQQVSGNAIRYWISYPRTLDDNFPTRPAVTSPISPKFALRLVPVSFSYSRLLRDVMREDKISRCLRVAGSTRFHCPLVAAGFAIREEPETPAARSRVLF